MAIVWLVFTVLIFASPSIEIIFLGIFPFSDLRQSKIVDISLFMFSLKLLSLRAMNEAWNAGSVSKLSTKSVIVRLGRVVQKTGKIQLYLTHI